jgi:hypothetical protein
VSRTANAAQAQRWNGESGQYWIEPAWMGSDVADVMSYIRGMPMIRSLAAQLGNETLTGRVLAVIAEQYAARQRRDGVWVRAAAWLVTAHRA